MAKEKFKRNNIKLIAYFNTSLTVTDLCASGDSFTRSCPVFKSEQLIKTKTNLIILCIVVQDITSDNGVFPKCFTEFSDKNICHSRKRARTCHLLCKRPGYYHSASKTHVRDRIFKFIYQIP